MKLGNLLFISFIVILFFIASCTQNNSKNSNEDLEFKKMCQNSGYEWMLMKPTQDGKFIKDTQECMGCMVKGIEHICDKEKFNEMTKTGMENGMNDMRSMQHMAMTAHAGTRSSVDAHMYKVGFVRPDIQPGKEALLKFTINDIQSKKPVSNLEVIHDKIMHIVLVRNDLKHFEHIHPESLEQGVFAVPFNFTASGFYRIWIDFTIDGMQHIVDFDINVPGNAELQEKQSLEGINVKFISPDKIIANQETELRFELFDKNNKPMPITEKFLAADAHLISIDESLEEFNHNHDEKFDKDNKISFMHTFAKSGRYKIWVQFSIEGKTKTGTFEVMVK